VNRTLLWEFIVFVLRFGTVMKKTKRNTFE